MICAILKLIAVLSVTFIVNCNPIISPFCETMNSFDKVNFSTLKQSDKPEDAAFKSCEVVRNTSQLSKLDAEKNLLPSLLCQEVKLLGEQKCKDNPKFIVKEIDKQEGEPCDIYQKALQAVPNSSFLNLTILDKEPLVVPSVVLSRIKMSLANPYQKALECMELCASGNVDPICRLAVILYTASDLPVVETTSEKHQDVALGTDNKSQEDKPGNKLSPSNSPVNNGNPGNILGQSESGGNAEESSELPSKDVSEPAASVPKENAVEGGSKQVQEAEKLKTETSSDTKTPNDGTGGEHSHLVSQIDNHLSPKEKQEEPVSPTKPTDQTPKTISSDPQNPEGGQVSNPSGSKAKVEATAETQTEKSTETTDDKNTEKDSKTVSGGGNQDVDKSKDKGKVEDNKNDPQDKQNQPENPVDVDPDVKDTQDDSTQPTVAEAPQETIPPESFQKNAEKTKTESKEGKEKGADKSNDDKATKSHDDDDNIAGPGVNNDPLIPDDENDDETLQDNNFQDDGNNENKDDGEKLVPEAQLPDPGERESVIPPSNVFPEQEDSHFFAYFLTVIIIIILAYLVIHNKQKILGLIVEGRGSQRRRSHSYRKLDTETSKGSQMIF